MLTRLDIKTIEAAPGQSPDWSRVGELQRDGVPPVVVTRTRKGYFLLEGLEALLAAKQAGLTHVDAEIRLLSTQDKRQAVMALLSDPQTRQHSNRAIAGQCGVDREFVAAIRGQLYPDQVDERLVKRGNQVFHQRPRRSSIQPNDSIALHLHDEPYSQVELPIGYADIILSVVPDSIDVSIADLAPRMAAHLNATGIACLIFNPFQALWLSDWLRALKDVGLLYRKLLCWQVTGFEPGRYRDALSDFELILVVGRRSIGGPTHPVIRGPHTPGVNHPNMQKEKPLWLILKLLDFVKQPRGSVLLDPLVESGVTLLGARAYGMAEATGCLLSAKSRKKVEDALNGDEIMPSVT